MSFIYPECPACDRKSPDGVPLHEMPEFNYDCPHCGFEQRGRFEEDPFPHVEWIGEPEDEGLLSNLFTF